MSISILAKVKEFTEFWRDRLHELYEFEKEMPPLKGDELIPEIKLANFDLNGSCQVLFGCKVFCICFGKNYKSKSPVNQCFYKT